MKTDDTMKTVLRIIIVLCLGLPFASRAEARTHIVPVDDGWAYRWGDSPRDEAGHPLFTRQADGWRSMKPFSVPLDGAGSKLLWIRLDLPEGDWRDPTLHLGDARNAYEVWTDSGLIGTAGIVRPSGMESPAGMGDFLFPLKREHLGRPVYLFLQAAGADAPALSRFAEVGERADFISDMFDRGLPVLLLSGFLFGLSIIAFVAALFRQSTRLFVAFGLFELFSAILSFAVGDAHAAIYPDHTLWYRLTFLSGFALIWSLGFFVDAAILEGRRLWFRRLITVIGVIAVLVAPIALASVDRLLSVQNLIIVLLVVALLPSGFVITIEARNRNVDAWIFLVGVFGLIALVASDVAPMLMNAPIHKFRLPWGALGVTLAFLAITSRRFIAFYKRLEVASKEIAEQNERSGALARELTEHARHLLGAVGTLNEARTDQSNQLASQAISLQQTQVTAEEIRQLSQRASMRAQTARELTDTMSELVRSGDAAIETSRTTIDAIRDESAAVARQVTALGERMREIAGIVGTVGDIARRSNMLALNAAVEAVRSGEHGKGFGIVSREMRALADQSIAATKNITRLIEEVALDTEDAESIARGATERVDAGVELLQASQAELRELTHTAATTTQHIVDIAQAIDQQHAGISQLTVAVQQLHEQMEGALATLTRAEQAAGSVDDVAQRMSALG